MKKVTILNAAVITAFGQFEFKHITLLEAQQLVARGFESAVGHQSTCDVLSELLKVSVQMNRVQFAQKSDDIALVFKLKARAAEGKVLSEDEIEAIGYEFATIEML